MPKLVWRMKCKLVLQIYLSETNRDKPSVKQEAHSHKTTYTPTSSSHIELMHQWENNPNCFTAICKVAAGSDCFPHAWWRDVNHLCWQTANHTMKSRAILCLCETRAEWCLGWSRHWCGAGEALSSHWAHSYWKCTQGKMHLRKALSERHSWAWESRVIDWWCTDSWLQIDTVLTNSAPNSLHMRPSPVAFHYNIRFTVLSQNISHYRAVRKSKHHLFLENYRVKGEETMLDCWLCSQGNHRWAGGTNP